MSQETNRREDNRSEEIEELILYEIDADEENKNVSNEKAAIEPEKPKEAVSTKKPKVKKTFGQKLKSKIINCLPAIVFFSFMMGFFGPVQLFVTNSSEFYFDIHDILYICIFVTAAVFVFLTVISLILPEVLSRWIGSIIFGCSLALYIQGNYITTNYGSLNGEAVDWSAFGNVPVWDTAIWIACIIIPIIIAAIKPKLARLIDGFGSVWIVLIQIVTLVVLIMNMQPKVQNNSDKIFSNEGKFELSDNNNVVMFILDCYDSKEFAAFIETHQEYKSNLLKDFTYYPDTVGGSTRTVLALPHILTGKPYIDGKNYMDYINNAYSQTKLYDTLSQDGYETGVYTESTFAPSENGVSIDNLYDGHKEVKNEKVLGQCLYKFTACKYFPHIFKKYVWMYSGEFDMAAVSDEEEASSSYVIDDAAFYKELCENRITLKDSNEFKLYHLNGAHPPYTLNSNATRSTDTTDVVRQQEGVMCILREYFNQMKALGIYDSSTIIICADHGSGGIEYNPVFLVKNKQEVSQFTVSDIPVSYDNLQPTILAAIGQNNTGKKSIWELTKDDNKERYFYYQLTNENVSVEYRITGNVGKKEKVEETGRRFSIFKVDDTKTYELGQKLEFNIKGTANAYTVKGLSKKESEYTCTNGNELVFSIPMEYNDSEDLYLEINCYMIFGDQRIGVSVNGRELNWYNLTDNTFRFIIPAEYVKGRDKLEISMQLPDAQLKESEGRSLSMAIYDMVIDKVYSDIELTPLLDKKLIPAAGEQSTNK